MKQQTIFNAVKKTMLAVLFAGFFGNANAQYTGPGSQAADHTVKQVSDNALKLDRKDTMVKIKGFIVEKIKDENYWFQDSTGKIRVEIDKKHLPATPFNDKTEVVIIGEVDYDLLEGTEIEVKKIEIPGAAVQNNAKESTPR
ncbi:TIGR00156 family protein [Mariniphaga anaerophila]|uniref:TIGR00156 family protein n=1 Tax=Mariniphaga anaerophila TaxID=1484053 RepID=A0A1M4XW47_9BACT|nr:NirD/YgiW/YdeI family stress tolerance protein [Mariniphaga anaerophila]SHE97721.1 TIGR00156 family protein [Mariniphaga anaerophila]